MPHALVLLSGGLDSILAARLLLNQGIVVTGICFSSPFFSSERGQAACELLQVPFHSIDITDDEISILKNPRYGFGSCANPCLDCHGQMLRIAVEMLPKFDAQFVATGEVLGQRPMSQHRNGLNLVAKLSGRKELILRPLSAKFLEPTLPEINGWVDRERLEKIHGRGRQRQIEMCREFNLPDHLIHSIGGGCLLTNVEIGRRVHDLLKHYQLDRFNASIISIGRHFRVSKRLKVVVSRNEVESIALRRTVGDNYLEPYEDYIGPTAVVSVTDDITSKDIQTASRLVASYSKVDLDETIPIAYKGKIYYVNAFSIEEIRNWII